MRSKPSRYVIPALLFLATVLVALNASFAFRAISALQASERWVDHTWMAINQVESIMSSAKDAETGNRGYLITGDDSYLDPYYAARRDLPGELDRFRTLTSDNPNQQQRLTEMQAVLDQRLSLLDQGIQIRRAGNTDSLRLMVLTGTGKAEMDHLRRIADDMETEEHRLLIVRTADADTNSRRVRYMIALASGLDFLFIIFMFRYLVRERDLRMAAELEAERLAAEKALVDSEARFHSLVEAMPLGLLLSDASGRILYANHAVERLLGYSEATLFSGSVTLQSISPELHKAHGELGAHKLLSEPFETICTRCDGQQIDVLIGVAILNPEAPRHEQQIAAFIADLSLQKKSEEVLRRTEKLAVAGRLAASISHEINNPLEAVTNCLYLVAHTNLPPEARGYLELAQKELDRVTQITVQTLRFYRASTRPANTDVHELINTVLALLEGRLRRPHVEVVRDFRAQPILFAHDGELRQVIANLVGNAIDALPEGGRITLRTANAHDWQLDRTGIAITVADTGTGMEPDVSQRIFEPFFSTKGITGTGLGLWISHEIVAKHHGRIRVRSRRSSQSCAGGTVFRLFIPAQNDSSFLEHSEQQRRAENISEPATPSL